MGLEINIFCPNDANWIAIKEDAGMQLVELFFIYLIIRIIYIIIYIVKINIFKN